MAEARKRGFSNALSKDFEGNIAETASTNVFMVRDGVVFTPVPNGTFLNGARLEPGQRVAVRMEHLDAYASPCRAQSPGASGGEHRAARRVVADDPAVAGRQALDQPVGAIAPGYRADITVLDPDADALMGRSGDQALDTWIFSGGNS